MEETTTTMAKDNFPALSGIYRVLFLYLEPSKLRCYRDIVPLSMVWTLPNSIHDRPSDHGLALSRRVLVSSLAYSIRPTCSDCFTGVSNINGCVATHKLSVHRAGSSSSSLSLIIEILWARPHFPHASVSILVSCMVCHFDPKSTT